MCLAYCVFYIVSCITKHFNNFWILFLGRLTGGVATSLLFAAFEAWLLGEQQRRNGGSVATAGSLSRLFGLMWFGNSLVAIAAGPAGDAAIQFMGPFSDNSPGFHYGGLTAAFDLAIVFLLLGLALMSATWAENKGIVSDEVRKDELAADPKDSDDSPFDLLARGLSAISESPALLALAVVIACFEGATYAFIFNWTPALTAGAAVQPALGRVFANLLLAYTSGSLAFQFFTSPRNQDSEDASQEPVTVLQSMLVVGPLSLLAPAIALSTLEPGSMEQTVLTLGGFLVFEFCCGMYAPAVSAVKGTMVPEQLRSTIYSTYRAPMNAVVLIVLLSGASTGTSLLAAAGLIATAAVAAATIPRNSASSIS